jgi:hypothetical protein
VSAESRVGSGTEIRFVLPIRGDGSNTSNGISGGSHGN